MAKRKTASSLYDPRNGVDPICVSHFESDSKECDPPRTNYFTIYWIKSGSGTFWADAFRFAFDANCLLFFVPYQHIRLVPDKPVQGHVIQFHANFLCVETFHAEVGCSGALFNDPYGLPFVQLDKKTKSEVTHLVAGLRKEQDERELAFQEVMLSQLKVLLVFAARLKSSNPGACRPARFDPQHPTLIQFRDLIEENYQTLHAPAAYAELMHVTAKTLGRIVRENLGTTPTELIRARVLTHAKWQLLHTLRPVKEIAREVGFSDELYFSRLFKKATGCSPSFFRDFETEIRGGSNLSMPLGNAPIHS